MANNPFEDTQSAPDANPFAETQDPSYSPKTRGAISEIANQGYAGVVSDLPEMVGKAAQYSSEEGKPVYEWGKKIADAAKARGQAPDLQADPDKHNGLTNILAQGARMIPQSIAPAAVVGGALAAAPAAIPGAAILGASAVLGSLPAAMSQGQTTLDKAREAGIADDIAIPAARKTAAIEGLGEAAGTYLGGKLLGVGGKAISTQVNRSLGRAAGTAAGDVLEETTGRAVLKPFLKQLPETMIGEVGTEMGQNAGQAYVEQQAGIDKQAPWEAAKEAVGPTVGMTLLLAPFGLAGHGIRAVQNGRRADTLSSAEADPQQRAAIADDIQKQLAKVDAAAAENFGQHAIDAISTKSPLSIGEHLFSAPDYAAQSDTANADLGTAVNDYTGMPSETAPLQLESNRVIAVPRQDGMGMAPINRDAGPLSDAAADAQENGLTASMNQQVGPLLKSYATSQEAEADMMTRADADRLQVGRHPRATDRFSVLPKSAVALAAQDAKASLASQKAQAAEQKQMESRAANETRTQQAEQEDGNAMPAGAENAPTTIERALLDSEQNTDQALGNSAPTAINTVADTVDEAAHAAATSELNDRPQPTDAQKSAGNYAKGHIRVGGLDMAIENPVGSTRSGTDTSGKPWTVTMGHHYGYIKATTGNDKDQVDTFVKRGTSTAHAGPVFVVDQVDPATGRFDEHKAMVGFENEADAVAAYKSNYAKGWTGMKAVTAMSMDQFKTWVKDGPKRLPASQDARVQEAMASAKAVAAENAPQAAQAVAEEAAQAEVRQSVGKQSTPRLERIAGETEDAYPARRAEVVNAKRASNVQTQAIPTQSKDTEAAIEALGDKATGTEAAVPTAEMPNQTEAKEGEISKQSAAFINHVAKLFGKRVVFVSGMSADGMRTAGNVIYLSTNSSVAHLRVLGHEMLHALKAQNAKSYNHMMDAVKGLLTDEEYTAQYKDYYGKAVPEGAELSASEKAFLAEEWMADLSGNRFAEEGFWKDVFTQVEAKHGTEAAKGIIAKLRLALVNALQKLMKLVTGPQFNVDARVAEHLDSIRKAIGEGFSEYAMAVKNGQVASEESAGAEAKFSEEKRQYKLDVNREERGTASRGQISLVEVKAIADAATKLGLDKARTAALVESAKEIRKRFPVKEGWAPIEATGVAAKKDDAGNIKVDKKGNPQVSVTWRPISYSFNVPAGKERAGVKMDMALVDKVADQFTKLVDGIYARAAEGNKNAQIIVGHQTWYRNVAAILRREFGAQGDLFADLLGATSPNTPVDTNWRFAVEILNRFSKGEFDTEMKAFIKHMDEGGSASKFPGQKIRQASEKLYGINSTNSMLALSNLWRAVESGTAPKARNFALNLIGQSNMATIDVWAARMLRRAAYAVRGMNLPRIPTVAEQGVTGTWNASASAVTGEFGFGAAVLDKVSQDLAKKGIDLSPPDLQALAWFAEKELWTEKNWTSAQGEGGSFEENIESTPTSRYLMGFSVQQGDVQPEESAVSTAQARLLAQLRGDDSVISARVLPTYGMFMGKPEEALDLEWTVKKGEHNPAMLMAEAASIAKERTQMAIFVSRVLAPDESNPNARPGAEVYFKKDLGMDRVKAVMESFTTRGLDGFTLAVDPRAKPSARPGQEFIGLRIQYIPEFDDVTPETVDAVMVERMQQLNDAVAELNAAGDVAFASVYKYDTEVVSGANYDEYIDRGVAGRDIPAGSQVRSGQSVRERLEGAAARIQSDAGQNGPGGVSDAGSAVPGAKLSTQRAGDGSGREEGWRTAGGQVQASERAVPQEVAPLAGAPAVPGFHGPDPRLVSVADQYARSLGIDLKRQSEYVTIDEARAKRLAAAYEAMPHAPQDPKVKEAYQNLIEQTVAQYRALESAGYKFWLMDMNKPSNVEYASTPWNAMRDIRANKEMGVFPTDDGFGSSASFDPANNPLLEDTGIKWPSGSLDGPKKRVLANDLFRAVHDAFGHGLEGSGFRAQGEENAWQAHSRLFTGSALGAITSETRGQNSWLNFGPHGEANQTAKVEDTVFADQKTGLMPEWTWTEGRMGDAKMSEKRQTETPEFKKWFGDSKVVDADGKPLVVYHGTPDGNFSTFALTKSGSSTTSRDAKVGFFFTDDSDFAAHFTERRVYDSLTGQRIQDRGFGKPEIKAVFLSLKKPLDLRKITPEVAEAIVATKAMGRFTTADAIVKLGKNAAGSKELQENMALAREELEALGFDGIINKVKHEQKVRVEFIAFNPTQIKSAIGNNGDFDGTNPDIRFSEKRSTEPFYSALSQEVSKLKMQTAPAFGWRDAIKGLVNKGLVKAEEIEWSGLNDWLELQTGKVTRDQVVQYLGANGVKVTETTLGGENAQRLTEVRDAADARLDKARANLLKVAFFVRGQAWSDLLNSAEAAADGDKIAKIKLDKHGFSEFERKAVDEYGEAAVAYNKAYNDKAILGDPKFGGYVVPGGENYREVLLTLPDGKNKEVLEAAESDTRIEYRWAVKNDSPESEQDALKAKLDAATAALKSANASYTSSHWDQKNVLAHIRLDDRTDADGNKVLFVQELQSDWGQQAKKDGVKGAAPTDAQVREYFGLKDGADPAEYRQEMMGSNKKGVPNAPFIGKTEGWLNLALKRVIKMAVDGGYGKVAFATGQQSADHYDLSKHVSEIKYNVTGDANYHLEIQDKRGSNIPVPRSLDADGLEAHVGKEIAQKIVDTATSEHKMLRGISLTVGGEGMKTFYDKIVPIAAGKLAAKLGGGKVENVGIASDRDGWHITPPSATVSGKWMVKSRDYNSKGLLFDTEAEAKSALAGKVPFKDQPGLTITDKMRENAAGGLPMFSKKRIVGDQGRTYTPDQLKAFDNVGFRTEDLTLKERMQAVWKDAGKKLAQGIADQFSPVKDLDGKAYGLLRLAKGAAGAFESLLKGGQLKLSDGVYDFDASKKGGVIDRLLKPLQGEHHDFLKWVAANRAERLMAQGKEVLFTKDDIAAIKTLATGRAGFTYKIQNGIRKGQTTSDRAAIYQDSLTTFNEFNTNVLDMAEQSGLIDGASRHLWEHEFYVPFYRVAEEADGGVRGMNIKGAAVRQQAFKALKGGKDKLNADLLDNTLMNWSHLLDASAKNRAAKATIEAAEKAGVAMGGNQSALASMGSTVGNKNGVVWFMDGGQKRYSLIDNQGDGPYIMTALTSLEYAGMRNPVMNAMGAMKHALTVGVTASPFFKVRNLIRDSVQVIGTGPISYNVGKNLVEGWKLTDPKSDAYFRLLAGGGTIHFGTMMEGSEAKRVQALVESGIDAANILDSDQKVKAFYRKFIEPAMTAYSELGNRGEAVNRASLYDQLIKGGMSHAEASLQARDLMDFSMAGSFTSVRFLTQVVPFMNARIQGLYKLGKAAKEDPARFSIVLGATALASLSLLAAYHDDDDWKKRTDSDRNNFWWFKFAGKAFRIPKPFEIGSIGTLAERGFELAFEKEMTSERFGSQVMAILGDQLSMNPIPQLVKPMLDVYANKNSFTGSPIENMAQQKLKSEYRFNDKTTMAARALGTANNAVTGLIGKEGLSPVQIDAMLQGYFGWLGTMVVSAGDYLARPGTGQPAQAREDYLKKLTGNIASDLRDAPSRYVGQMYEQAKSNMEAYDTWRALIREQKPEDAKAFFESNKKPILDYHKTEAAKKSETLFNNMMRMVERNRDLDPDQKREKIRAIQAQKEAVARRAVATQ